MFFDDEENIAQPYLLKFWISDEIVNCCKVINVKTTTTTTNTITSPSKTNIKTTKQNSNVQITTTTKTKTIRIVSKKLR